MTNGYIQVDVLGRRRGLKFGMLAAQQIMLQAHKLNATLGNSIDLALVPAIIYWGLWNNCYNKQEDPDFTFEQVSEWVDENMDKAEMFGDVVKCFYESKVVASSLEKLVKEDEKKSSTSPPSPDGTTSEATSQERSESGTTTG